MPKSTRRGYLRGALLAGVAAGLPGADRHLAPELARVVELVRGGAVVQAVEAVTGPLG